MGRIDDALRRSHLDVAGGTGAPAWAAPSPWLFDEGQSGAPEPVDRAGDAGLAADAAGRVTVREAPAGRAVALDLAPGRTVVAQGAEPLLVEQFRSLAAMLLHDQRERPLHSLLVTSASPRDGKSWVAVNLALTLGESYRRRVLLIDADLRRPTLHTVFRVANTGGLSEALRAKGDEKLPTQPVNGTVALLPAGRPEPNPLGSLSSGRMKRIVADAASRFDWVIVDAPPAGLLADGRLVAETVDAAILVVRAGVTRLPDLQLAIESVGRERILGIALNAVDPRLIDGGRYYHHYYRPEPRSGA